MIICPRCARPLPDWLFRDRFIQSMCANCQVSLDVHVFPAFYQAGERLDPVQLSVAEGDACCYHHSTRKASALCANCGRFLCALCEVQLGSQVLCPDCVDAQRTKAPSNVLATQRTKYDSIALALATWPLLIFYSTLITAPLSLGMSLYAWNRPTSIVRRSRWRLFVALGLSLLELAGIVTLIFAAVYASRRVAY